MKKSLPIIALIIVAMVGGLAVFFLSKNNSSKRKALNDTEYYKHLLDTPIHEIRLRKTVTSPEWAVFDDADLIAVWTEYLKTAEVKHEKHSQNTDNDYMNGGGIAVIDITTGSGSFSLLISDSPEGCKIQLGNIVYIVNSSTAFPFDYTYNEAIERHGITSPW